MPAALRVNPTRIELTNLKKRLKTAIQGHKLLKDKRDEMMRRFVVLVRENRRLRMEVEEELEAALKDFVMARASMDAPTLETALLVPVQELGIKVDKLNVMSVTVPHYVTTEKKREGVGPFPYGMYGTSGDLDAAIRALNRVLLRMVELAEVEKATNMLASEIEKTRRRVNALEYVMIPQFEEAIASVSMKLEENERASLTRLMKVKAMLAERNEAPGA